MYPSPLKSAPYICLDETLWTLLVTIDNQYHYDDDIEMDETDLFIEIFSFFLSILLN